MSSRIKYFLFISMRTIFFQQLMYVRRSAHGQKHQRQAVARQQGLPKSQWTIANGLHTNQNSPVSKLEINQKYGTHCDQKASSIVNGSKVWTRKSKTEIDKVVLKTIKEKEPDQVKNQEVLIGSISVNLSNCSQSEGNMVASQKDFIVENILVIASTHIPQKVQTKEITDYSFSAPIY